MAKLAVLSYPNVTDTDLHWMLQIRRDNPELESSSFPLHFTLLFPLDVPEEEMLIEHVRKAVQGFGRISFALRCAAPVKDDSKELYYVMLVPDEGYSLITRLHDALYSGPFAGALRLDLLYTPHITIGFNPDPFVCKLIVDGLNREPFEIRGDLISVDVVRVEGERGSIAHIKLE